MTPEEISSHLSNTSIDEVGSGWWTAWAWLVLTLGNLMLFVKLEGDAGIVTNISACY